MSPPVGGQGASGHPTDTEADPAGPLGRLLDVGVFAPLGFLTDPSKVVSDLASQGRKQLEFSRSLGRAALRTIARRAKAGDITPTASPAAAAATDVAVVDGYDSMTAREIIASVADADPAEQRWMLHHEQAHKARKTVLARLEQALGAD